MRVFVTWLVALGMIVSPAMAGTDRPGDDKDTTPKNGAASATAEKDKTADATATTAKPNAAAATPSSLETEIQQLRDLIESQTKLLQAQSEQLKEQQHRMQLLESEVSSSSSSSNSPEASPPPRMVTHRIATRPVLLPCRWPAFQPPAAGPKARGKPAANHRWLFTSRASPFRPAVSWRLKRFSAIRPRASDINTGFNSIPFSGNSGGQTTEFNASARQSRLSYDPRGQTRYREAHRLRRDRLPRRRHYFEQQ